MDTDMEVRDCYDEDDIITSDFTVAETFGYLTLQSGNRLCRVSTDWKALLSRHALFNKGIIFFQWEKKRPKRYWWHAEEQSGLLWGDQLYLEPNTMNHFVFLEKLNDRQWSIDYGPLCDKLVRTYQPLNTVTLYRHRIAGRGWGLKPLGKLLLKMPMTVRFVDCVLNECMAWFRYFSESNGWDCDPDSLDYLSWDVSLPRKNYSLNTEELRTLEAAIAANEEDSDEEERRDPVLDAFDNWLVPASPDEIMSLVWSHPVDQLHWLQTCLESLETIVSADVVLLIANTYRVYREYRGTIFSSQFDELMTRMCLQWHDRELDIVDCGFLARLLNMTPGVPKPPYDLPKDVRMKQARMIPPKYLW